MVFNFNEERHSKTTRDQKSRKKHVIEWNKYVILYILARILTPTDYPRGTEISINHSISYWYSWYQLVTWIKHTCENQILTFQPLHQHSQDQRAITGHQGLDQPAKAEMGCKSISKSFVRKWQLFLQLCRNGKI